MDNSPLASPLEIPEDDPATYLVLDFNKSSKRMEKKGFTVVRSTDNTLLLDLDTGAQQDHYRAILPKLKGQYAGLMERERWASKSGHGLHVVLDFPMPMKVEERLLLQACLGSDPIRESLGLKLLQAGIDNPIMLFKPGATTNGQ